MNGRIKAAMQELGLYRMAAGGLAAGEVEAYESVVSMMEQWLQTMLKEILLMTAETYGLEYWEDALGIRGSGSVLQRRLRIRETLCRRPGRFDGVDFLYRLEKINPSICLETEGKNLLVHDADRGNLDELSRLAALIVRELSPIAKVALDGTGQTWTFWEGVYKNWNYFDRVSLPWAFHDTV